MTPDQIPVEIAVPLILTAWLACGLMWAVGER